MPQPGLTHCFIYKSCFYQGILFLCFIFLLLTSLAAWAGEKAATLSNTEDIKAWLENGSGKVEDIPNPHWNENGCEACHKGRPDKKSSRLRINGINKTCNNCHDLLGEHDYIHPLNVSVPRKMREHMPAEFRKTLFHKNKSEQSLSCSSCHDILIQCTRKQFSEEKINSTFIRGGPYRSRTELCYQCHNRKAYQRLNAHEQISESGEVLVDKCLICHIEVPEELDDGSVVNAELQVKSDYEKLCLNCHRWVPHPGGDFPFLDKGGPMHLVKPSAGILQQMVKMEKLNGLILPRDDSNGKVYCATCHNPHARGVIKNPRAARGAGEPKRLRSNPICENCHDL